MNAQVESYPPQQDERLQYRAMSSAAVASLVLGVGSIVTVASAFTSVQACLFTAPVPIAGLILGLRAMLSIRKLPEEYTGMGLAVSGVVLSAGLLTVGLGLAFYTYATEVPDGYQRVAFHQMKPDVREKGEGQYVPPEIQALEGKPVFLKGYMRPPSQTRGLDSFLLVRDNEECCFGKNLPDYFDQVQIQLAPPLLTDYAKTKVYKVGGTLHIDPASARPGSREAVFTLSADYLK